MKPWPLDVLLNKDRNAAGIYLALRWLAGKNRRLATTRARIAKICPMHEDTITKAMKFLSDAGWIGLNYGRAGIKRWYRVTFPITKQEIFPMAVLNGHSKKRVCRSKRPKQTVCYGRSKRPLSSKEDIGANSPAPNRSDDSAQELPEHESVGIERDLLRIAKSKRESG